ncbi:MAG: cob(I)yrinic acid a,c-diamide adenosyltransferase [Prevotella sp.]
MPKIFTKRGDGGQTSLADGSRVDKNDARIEANGCMDELNSILGIVRAMTTQEMAEEVRVIQQDLMIVMTIVAGGQGDFSVLRQHTARFEQLMSDSDLSFRFVIPGDNLVSAWLDMARAHARTCERRLWKVNDIVALPQELMAYANRLSDYLFWLARRVPSL